MPNRRKVFEEVIRLRAGRSGVLVSVGDNRFLCSPIRPDRLGGPSRLLFRGQVYYLGGCKGAGPEAVHSPVCGEEVKCVELYFCSPLHFTFAYIRNALNNKARLLFYVQDEKP
jgi:hypothetical protein